MKQSIILCLSVLILGCQSAPDNDILEEQKPQKPLTTQTVQQGEVKVLNVGTFHMDYTTDGHSEEFDENDAKNRKQCLELAEQIAQFKPTVILIETLPENNQEMQDLYSKFRASNESQCDFKGEIGLVAFPVGKMCDVDRIYGIDHKIYYNFQIAAQMIDDHPSRTYRDYMVYVEKEFRSEGFDDQHLIEKIYHRNTSEYYDFMLNINADILTYVNSDSLWEGADEAAQFYKRNLRMYANMNKIDLSKDDRVLVFMGAAHTAFFDDFMNRSPRYHSVNVLDYLLLP